MRPPRNWPLFLLLAGPIAYQIAHSVDSYHVYNNGPEEPFLVDFNKHTLSSVTEEAKRAGLQEGDLLLTFNGKPYLFPYMLKSYLRRVQAGTTMQVTYSRQGSQPRAASIVLAPQHKDMNSWNDWIIPVFADFLTRWVALLLGCFVVAMRPRDPLAWLVLFLMISYGQLASGAGRVAEGWGEPWRALGTFYQMMANITWPAWMLLFGVYFPDPKSRVRLAAWSRWAVALPILLFALLVAALETGEQMGHGTPEWLNGFLRLSSNVFLVLTISACALYFANISYKASKEKAPDARRRLRLLFWGTNISLTPLFIMIMYSRFTNVRVDQRYPVLFVAAIVLLFLFPLTLGYVIVVQKAMDVRVVLRQGLQYALAQRGVRVITALLMTGIIWWTFEAVAMHRMHLSVQLRSIGLAVLAIVLLQKGAAKLRSWVDRRFFREQVEVENVLAELTAEVRQIADAEELKRRVCSRVSESMHVERVAIKNNGSGDGWELTIPMTAGADTMGHLVLGPKKSEEPYTRSDRRLLETVATQTALALENARLTSEVAQEAARRERIHRELEIAREVQERLFPHHPPGIAGLDYTGVCKPAQSVGGDYYDFFLAGDNVLTLAVGDICGKGVSAALLMASLQASLRGLCAGGVMDLGELMSRLNTLVYDATPKNRFATLWCGQYDPHTSLLRYASAGHGDAVLLRETGAVERTGSRGLALGLVRQSNYTYGEVRLEPGDVIAVCTDGVTEARNIAGDEFGEEALFSALEEARGMCASGIVGHVLGRVEEYSRGAEQHDDITVVAARVIV